MSDISAEFLVIADQLETVSATVEDSDVREPLAHLEQAAKTVGKAWSGSWLGYQAQVYYEDLQSPPPGAHFSQEWGFQQLHTIRTTIGAWKEFGREELEEAIHKLAGNPSLEAARRLAEKAERAFEDQKPEVLSLLSTALRDTDDTYLSRLKDEADTLKVFSRGELIHALQPSRQIMSRDSLAIGQGFRTPPHYSVLSEVFALREPTSAC